MKPTRILRLAILCAMAPINLLAAQDTSPSPTAASFHWASMLIPALVPIAIAGIKLLAPRVPKFFLPVLAPVLGAGLEVILHYANLSDGSTLAGMVLGMAGVMVREFYDQTKKLLALPPVQ